MGLNPYRAYQAASVTGRSALDLVIMLFEGLVKNLGKAKEAVLDDDVEGAHERLVKAQRIIVHLLPTVNDEAGEAAARLKGLYFFCLEKIVKANFNKSAEEIDEALRVIAILQDTWRELHAQERTGAPAPLTAPGLDPAQTSHAMA